jgi:hypothetical protein
MWYHVVWQKITDVSDDAVTVLRVEGTIVKMEAIGFSKNSANLYQATGRHISEDSLFHSRRFEKIRSYKIFELN